MSSKTSALSRRSLFSGAATVGAVAAATAVLPGVVQSTAPAAPAMPKPTRYWLMKSEPDEFSIDDLANAPSSAPPGSVCAITRRAISCAI